MRTVVTLKIELESDVAETSLTHPGEEGMKTRLIEHLNGTRFNGVRVAGVADLSPFKSKIWDGMGNSFNLSSEVYRIELSHEGKPESIFNGVLVRMISGVRPNGINTERSEVPGFHYDPNYATVCPIWSKRPQWSGFPRKNLVEVKI
jgi:hypothetical protein